jgi:hypothetical protein
MAQFIIEGASAPKQNITETGLIDLPEVQLVTVHGGEKAGDFRHYIRALRLSMLGVRFGRVTFLCTDYSPVVDGIEVLKIPSINDRLEYSVFCIKELWKYVSLPFCLLIQADGFVVTPHKWDNEFLKYDYIGAPWSGVDSDASRVGNGGFSLRSQKFLSLCGEFPFPIDDCEDHLMCRVHRDWFIHKGVRFAPVPLAAEFSREERYKDDGYDMSLAFGFHGWARGREAYKFLIHGFDESKNRMFEPLVS